jgi:PASTA domain/TIR domain
MRAIFISYRRNDSEGEAGRLFDDLVDQFGEDSVFMDVTTIEAGRDFRKAIDESVATCGVLLAIIGKNWLDAKDDAGKRRLDDPTDFVRLETASALRRDIPVIPVIVRGASMPHPDQLPDDLKDLAYRNFVELTHARWTPDIQLLIAALRKQLGAQTSKPEQVVAESPEIVEEIKKPVAQPPSTPLSGGTSKESAPGKKKSWLIPASAIGIVALVALVYLLLPRQVTVPNLRGKSLSDATAALEASHLKAGHTTTRDDATTDANVVLSQYPPSDEQVKRGTAVDLVVSAAATQVEIPPLIGQTLEWAQRLLADHHLAVGEVERQSRAGAARDLVLQEFPQAGQTVRSGAKVDLLVSDVPLQATAAPSNATPAKTADATWATQRAAERTAARKAAALKVAADNVAAAASDKAASDKAIADKTAADKPAADEALAQRSRAQVTVRSATCTTLSPGKYQVNLAGDATAPGGEPYLFYTWVAIGTNGTRWRPACKNWSLPQASDDSLWEVSCLHRPNDPSQTSWETSRIISTKDQQPPTNGGTSIFPPGGHGASNLKFSLRCQ